MVAANKIGCDFAGVVRYQFEGRRDRPSDKVPEILSSRGIGTQSVEEIIADFEMGRQARPGLKQAVWHVSLSFNPQDAARLDSAQMRRIAEDYLRKMKLTDTQFLIVRHHDAPDNQHLHIIVNRVADNGRALTDGRNFHRSKTALQELVAEYGLTPPDRLHPERQHPERLRGSEAVRHELRETVQQEVRNASTRPALLDALRARQVEVRERVNQQGEVVGVSFAQNGVAFKGSELGRELSSAGIDRQLAANREQAAREQAAREQAAREQAAREQAAREQAARQLAEDAMIVVRRQQEMLSERRREIEQAEQAREYGRVAELKYGAQPEAMLVAQLAAAREQAAQTPYGQYLLREYDAQLAMEARQARAQQAAEAERLRQVAEAEQAREAAQQAEAVALRHVREYTLALETAQQQAGELEQAGLQAQATALRRQTIEPMEQQLAASRQRAGQRPEGQAALAELDERLRREEQADQRLRQLAQQPGLTSWEHFQERAAAVGYFVRPAERGPIIQVLEERTQQQLVLPAEGRALHQLVGQALGRHEWEQSHLSILDNTVAQAPRGLQGVRLLVPAAHAEKLRQTFGNSARPDASPQGDGRVGVTLLYNPSASTWPISAAVKQARERGGQVFEHPTDALRREQSTQADYNAPWVNQQPGQDRGMGR